MCGEFRVYFFIKFIVVSCWLEKSASSTLLNEIKFRIFKMSHFLGSESICKMQITKRASKLETIYLISRVASEAAVNLLNGVDRNSIRVFTYHTVQRMGLEFSGRIGINVILICLPKHLAWIVPDFYARPMTSAIQFRLFCMWPSTTGLNWIVSEQILNTFRSMHATLYSRMDGLRLRLLWATKFQAFEFIELTRNASWISGNGIEKLIINRID